jgi:hypothetical protein
MFCFSFLAFSQVPGFLGKRLSINIGAHVSPILFDRLGNVDDEGTGSFINKRFSIGAEYVLSRKWSVSANFHIQNSATNELDFDTDIERGLTYKLGYSVKSNGASLQFIRFNSKKSDFIAPVGRYFSLGLMVSNFSLVDTKGNVFKAGTRMSSGSISGFTVGLGRNRVFFERILFSYGIEAAYLFYFKPFEAENDLSEMITAAKKRVFQVSFLNLKTSIGYLF